MLRTNAFINGHLQAKDVYIETTIVLNCGCGILRNSIAAAITAVYFSTIFRIMTQPHPRPQPQFKTIKTIIGSPIFFILFF